MARMELAAATKIVCEVFRIACGPNRLRPGSDDLPSPADGDVKATNGMERFWIKCLHKAFAEAYERQEGVAVLSKACEDKLWHRNEFLHDVAVVERVFIKSAYLEREIPVLRRSLWQVESELAGDGREVAIDLSKLIAGSAEAKLLIVRRPVDRQVDGQTLVREFVKQAWGDGSGHLFLAFLPAYSGRHPHVAEHWANPDKPLPVDLFHCAPDAADNGWTPIPCDA